MGPLQSYKEVSLGADGGETGETGDGGRAPACQGPPRTVAPPGACRARKAPTPTPERAVGGGQPSLWDWTSSFRKHHHPKYQPRSHGHSFPVSSQTVAFCVCVISLFSVFHRRRITHRDTCSLCLASFVVQNIFRVRPRWLTCRHVIPLAE